MKRDCESMKLQMAGDTFCRHGSGAADIETAGLEVAQRMAGHFNAKTTDPYDRRGDEISLDGVEKIRI